jgi:hypothetical protein
MQGYQEGGLVEGDDMGGYVQQQTLPPAPITSPIDYPAAASDLQPMPAPVQPVVPAPAYQGYPSGYFQPFEETAQVPIPAAPGGYGVGNYVDPRLASTSGYGVGNYQEPTPWYMRPGARSDVPMPNPQDKSDISNFASVRYKNPGSIKIADWGQDYGARSYGKIDQGNTIMEFPDKTSGAAAWFHLMGTPRYMGKTLQQIGEDYTGITHGAVGKGTTPGDLKRYINTISKATGLKPTDTLTPEFLAGPGGRAWAKAQWSAEGPGKGYPISDDELTEGQNWGIWGQKPGELQ